MARSVKKVRKPKTKKFWIILGSTIGVAFIGLIIGLLAAYALNNSATTVNRFSKYTKEKINYNELEYIIEDKKEEYDYKEMFVFVYDSSYQIEAPSGVKTTDPAYKTYEQYVEASEKLDELYSLIQKVNEKKGEDAKKTGFYVINGGLSSNSSALSNETYDSFTSPALLTFYLGKGNDKLNYIKQSDTIEAKKYNDESSEEKTYTNLSGGSSTDALIYAIKNVEDYLEYTYSVSVKD